MRRTGHWVWIGLLASLMLGGCGFQMLKGARDSFVAAKAAGAETKAPFEYYSAKAYLGMAEDEWEEFDWKAVEEWATKSNDYSEQALKVARGGGK